jgi:hypothetical protein
MRLLVLALALVPCVLACTSEDPAPLFVDTDYQVRCVDCEPQAADDPARHVEAIDGERNFSIECSVHARGDDQVMTFSAAYRDPERESRNYSFSVIQANLDGDPGSSCRVSVSEGANTYEGPCTAGEPSAEKPCSVELESEHGVITGTVRCENIPNRNADTVKRHVVAPGSRDPVELHIEGCTGL